MYGLIENDIVEDEDEYPITSYIFRKFSWLIELSIIISKLMSLPDVNIPILFKLFVVLYRFSV